MGNSQATQTVTLYDLQIEPRCCMCGNECIVRGVTDDNEVCEFVWKIKNVIEIDSRTTIQRMAAVVTFQSYRDYEDYFVVTPVSVKFVRSRI